MWFLLVFFGRGLRPAPWVPCGLPPGSAASIKKRERLREVLPFLGKSAFSPVFQIRQHRTCIHEACSILPAVEEDVVVEDAEEEARTDATPAGAMLVSFSVAAVMAGSSKGSMSCASRGAGPKASPALRGKIARPARFCTIRRTRRTDRLAILDKDGPEAAPEASDVRRRSAPTP